MLQMKAVGGSRITDPQAERYGPMHSFVSFPSPPSHPKAAGNLDQIARRYDNTLNATPNMTCRVWVLTIIRDLVTAHLVPCRSITELEQECFAAGNHYSTNRIQPRPTVRPNSCS